MQRIKRDHGLTARIVLAFVVLALVYFVFLSILAYFGIGMIPLIAIGVFMVLIQYLISDKIVLWSTGARIVSREEYPILHDITDRLVMRIGLKKPKLAVMYSDIPNAFATGKSKSSAVVAVTSGLLNLLDDEELEGVIAHELAHIKNRDMLAITLASLFSTVAWYVMHYGWYGVSYNRRDNSAIIIAIIVAMITWFVSFLITRAISRYREYVADRDGAIITGKPIKLANALMKISGKMSRIPTRDLREVESLNAFFIIPAIGDSLANIFATHPPVEARIKRLMAMEERLY
ncbi:MAG: zinc metalloprotease HtpX [Candidatus Nitrosocaldaceae archaeon]